TATLPPGSLQRMVRRTPMKRRLHHFVPQLERAAARMTASLSAGVKSPAVTNSSAVFPMADTYCPWFLQVPPDAGPRHGTIWSTVQPLLFTTAPGAVP